ncbi:NRDE family protein [Dechloromonas sp. ZY10]|uniref:NRDE family protein n=1 Tax=Dechloromonas aquae TaxID=2664436 RepID=UPI0035298247
MCLIVIGWRVHPDYPLVVAANRDEFYARPTAAATHWPESPQVIAGRDLEAGGTWLGITERGRFAAVTNVREPGQPPGRYSRGQLTRDFLCGEQAALPYLQALAGADYAGFNLLVADGEQLAYFSNRGGSPQTLDPGVYGLSNRLLDSPWPKLLKARERFAAALPQLPDEQVFVSLLADDEIVPDHELPQTGVSLEWERRLSAIFVRSENYGTRASTVVWQRADGIVQLHEQSYGPHGAALQSSLISTSV